MENKTEQKKEINVKRVFFYEGELIPSFELDDGTIKRAYFAKMIQGERTLWYTDEEFEAKKQKLDSEKAKIKLVDKQGKKLGN